VGAAPVSQTLHQYLAGQQCPTLRIDARPVKRDFLTSRLEPLRPPAPAAVAALARLAAPGDGAWLDLWLSRAERVMARLDTALSELPWGETVAAAAVCRATGYELLHLGNSMAVRHGNLHVRPSRDALRVYANRGLNGTDGTLGSFVGELARADGPGLLLVGDQATLHDLPALEAASGEGLRGCICIMNNGGAALFDLLDIASLPGYTDAVRHPTRVDFGAVAAAFDLSFRRCTSTEELGDALTAGAAGDRLWVAEASVPPDSLAREFLPLVWSLVG
jgi:2-succinyl-5-enolpyruvyl-6-hydroxy-3-cyclohexene-1-carboxylate synthase